MKNLFKGINEKLRRRMLTMGIAMMAMMCSAVSAFAAEGDATGAAGDFVLSSGDLDPILNSIKSNVKVVLPVMLVVLGIFIVIGLIPKLIKRATHG